MKKIYFVRHGESEGNAGIIRQGPQTPLTERGKKQAHFIAARSSKLPLEVIISSTMRRAQETADIIANTVKKPVELSNLFIERRGPTNLIGKSKDDPEVLHAEQVIKENFPSEDFRFSDEENFDDLKKRADFALKLLQTKSEENILVVTHGFFMRVMLAYAVFDNELTGYECERFMRAFRTENTGLTVLLLDHEDNCPVWRIWTWNDHAHLG
jgi:broad specificity phosphatase PhoE